MTDVRREKPKEIGFQIDGEVKEEKPDPLELLDKIKEDAEAPARKKVLLNVFLIVSVFLMEFSLLQRKELPRIRVKPSVIDREREKTLEKIATRGVVQLFNAVRNQQKDLEQKLEEAGPLMRKKEKVNEKLLLKIIIRIIKNFFEAVRKLNNFFGS